MFAIRIKIFDQPKLLLLDLQSFKEKTLLQTQVITSLFCLSVLFWDLLLTFIHMCPMAAAHNEAAVFDSCSSLCGPGLVKWL